MGLVSLFTLDRRSCFVVGFKTSFGRWYSTGRELLLDVDLISGNIAAASLA